MLALRIQKVASSRLNNAVAPPIMQDANHSGIGKAISHQQRRKTVRVSLK